MNELGGGGAGRGADGRRGRGTRRPCHGSGRGDGPAAGEGRRRPRAFFSPPSPGARAGGPRPLSPARPAACRLPPNPPPRSGPPGAGKAGPSRRRAGTSGPGAPPQPRRPPGRAEGGGGAGPPRRCAEAPPGREGGSEAPGPAPSCATAAAGGMGGAGSLPAGRSFPPSFRPQCSRKSIIKSFKLRERGRSGSLGRPEAPGAWVSCRPAPAEQGHPGR